jgi:hypothetical protein
MTKRYAITIILTFAAAAAAAGVASADRHPRAKRVVAVIHTVDYGCAGHVWTSETIRRVLKVFRNDDGSYRISEQDTGKFMTKTRVRSPGNCAANRTRHGHFVRAGVAGTVTGSLNGTVTDGSFDRDGSCADPCTQSGFIESYFGADAKFSCLTNSRDCKFRWAYHAKRNQRLRFRYWEDRGTGAGTFLKERFQGDIASA